ncbi:MAG: hypothetical protein IPG23_05465 [Burkholderiales bacterium]|nr:hypothetical protein [Burkholderiales bacterium]
MASGTATSGADFGASSGTLTFAPNVTSQTFTVAITNDTTFEGAENYTANLSAPTGGATIATGTVTTTINDDGTGGPPGTDNDTPALSIADISVVEGASAVFTVSLSTPAPAPWYSHQAWPMALPHWVPILQAQALWSSTAAPSWSPCVDCCERQCDHPRRRHLRAAARPPPMM